MDRKRQAEIVFDVKKPAHFVSHEHCRECAEHDATLSSHDRDSMGPGQLGNPSRDRLCFTSAEGMLYYMPAPVRPAVDTIDNPGETYLEQMLFHLIRDGEGNRPAGACGREQREFIAGFLAYWIERHGDRVEEGVPYPDDIFKAHEIWSAA